MKKTISVFLAVISIAFGSISLVSAKQTKEIKGYNQEVFNTIETKIDDDYLEKKQKEVYQDKSFLSELTRFEQIYNEDNYKNDFVPGEIIVGMKTSVAESKSFKYSFSHKCIIALQF